MFTRSNDSRVYVSFKHFFTLVNSSIIKIYIDFFNIVLLNM